YSASAQQFVVLENCSSRVARLACSNNGQVDETGFALCVVHALGGFDIVFRTSKKDVGDKCLRVAIVEREPSRLNLNHDAVTGKKDVVRRWKSEFVSQRCVGCECLWSRKSIAIPAAENVHANCELVASQFWLAW